MNLTLLMILALMLMLVPTIMVFLIQFVSWGLKWLLYLFVGGLLLLKIMTS